MHRPFLVTAVLVATSLVAPACKPTADTFDAGCYPAPISTPVDAGVDAGCITWSGGCDSTGTGALQTAIDNAFAVNGTCQADTDCALYGSTLKMNCYETTYTPTIALAQRGALDLQLQAILCGYCNACFPDGGLEQGDVNPQVDGGNCTEVSCLSGQCEQQTFQE